MSQRVSVSHLYIHTNVDFNHRHQRACFVAFSVVQISHLSKSNQIKSTGLHHEIKSNHYLFLGYEIKSNHSYFLGYEIKSNQITLLPEAMKSNQIKSCNS